MTHKQRITLQGTLAFIGLMVLFPPLIDGDSGFLLTLAPWQKIEVGTLVARVVLLIICTGILWLHYGRDTTLSASSYNRLVDKAESFFLPETLNRKKFFMFTSAASVLIAAASSLVGGIGTFLLFYVPFGAFYLRCVAARARDTGQPSKKWTISMGVIVGMFALSADSRDLHQLLQAAWAIGHLALLLEKPKLKTA